MRRGHPVFSSVAVKKIHKNSDLSTQLLFSSHVSKLVDVITFSHSKILTGGQQLLRHTHQQRSNEPTMASCRNDKVKDHFPGDPRFEPEIMVIEEDFQALKNNK